jgi:SAM-dependent methyltransferase
MFEKDDLIACPNCPVCGSVGTDLYSDVSDYFFGFQGQWNIKICPVCETTFLDPCLKQDSISKAYTQYYTHKVEDRSRVSLIARLALAAVRLHEKLDLAKAGRKLGASTYLVYTLLTSLRALVSKRWCQHLYFDKYIQRNCPQGGKVLEVGCGAGDYMARVLDIGFEIIGIDVDDQAVTQARLRGLNVLSHDLDYFIRQGKRFDYVIMHHVIEHLHNPSAYLQKLKLLLKRNGRIWLETPNNKSKTATIFGKYWRGHEVPRHIQVFNRRSLIHLLEHNGFVILEEIVRESAFKYMFDQSYLAMTRSGASVKSISPLTGIGLVRDEEKYENEFITVICGNKT